MPNNKYQEKFYNAIIMPCKDVINFREDLKSGKKALNEMNTYDVNDNVTNVVIQLKSAAPFTNYVDHANIDRGYMPDSICSIFSRLDIKCRYSWDRKTKLFIDENSITAKTENTIIKSLSDSKKCLTSFDALKCIYTAIIEPSDVDNNKLAECKDTHNISDVSPHTKFIADAIVARAQYLELKPTHDMLLDSGDIVEECYFCPSEVSKELVLTTHNDETAENAEL